MGINYMLAQRKKIERMDIFKKKWSESRFKKVPKERRFVEYGLWSIKKVTTNLFLATNPDSNFMAHATQMLKKGSAQRKEVSLIRARKKGIGLGLLGDQDRNGNPYFLIIT